MADGRKAIKCPGCGRSHEVDPKVTGMRFECGCGKWLDMEESTAASGGEGQQGAGGAARARPSKGVALAVGLRSHWKLASVTAVVVITGVVGAMFVRGPEFTFAHWWLWSGKRVAAPEPVEDPDLYLRALEDNERVGEHALAAAKLLRLNDAMIVPRLCRAAVQKDLLSRTTVVRLLGQKGDERALETLAALSLDRERAISEAAVTAIVQIGTPEAENEVRRQMHSPVRAKEILPVAAMVGNDLAARLLRTSLKDPALRGQTLGEIGGRRVHKCLGDVASLASDAGVEEADRLTAVETLGRFDTPEARRLLIKLTESNAVGWKARQVLEGTEKR